MTDLEHVSPSLIALPADDAGYSGSAEYFYTVLRAGAERGIVSAQEVSEIQCELWALMGRLTHRYTMGDSSSVPMETAQELLHAVCFCAGMELGHCGSLEAATQYLRMNGVVSVFEKGRRCVKEQAQRGKELLEALHRTAPRTKNRAYWDTVYKALPAFFRSYDMEYRAHEIPCDIDYQLFRSVEGLEGIEYINEYMRRLTLENRFVAAFDADLVHRLLEGYCKEPDEQLINLFDPVFVNATGLALLGKNCMRLEMRDDDRNALQALLEGAAAQEVVVLVQAAVVRVCEKAAIEWDSQMQAYLLPAGKELCDRLRLQLPRRDLKALFPSFGQKQRDYFAYADGDPMPDEALRSLILEMRDCRFTADKIAMLKRQVRSLRDYIEIVPECFDLGEYQAVFALLGEAETAALIRLLNEKYGGEWPQGCDSEWELAFAQHVVTLPDCVKAGIQILGGDAAQGI